MARRGGRGRATDGGPGRGTSPAARRGAVLVGVLGAAAGAGWFARLAVERRLFAAVRGDR